MYVKADPDSIERIVDNLIDNAIKYTPDGGKIKISLSSNDNNIVFVVKDSGIGISKDKIEFIFDPYFQISNIKSNKQGVGLGLNIVKKIIDSLKGKIEIDSKVDEGRVFRIFFKKSNNIQNCKNKGELSVSNIVSSVPFHTELQEKEIKHGKINILVVEDNIDLLSDIQEALYKTYNIYLANNGQEALTRLNQIPKPDLVLSDIMMDFMDGYELISKLSQTNEYKDVPVIFITAKTAIEDELKGLFVGAIDYIYKPFSMDILKLKIHNLLQFNNMKRALFEANKLASIGLLVSEVSHEILNPINIIYAPLENMEAYLVSKKLNDEKICKYFKIIYNSLLRITSIIKHLKILESKKNFKEEIDMKILLDTASSILKKRSDKKIEIEYLISKDFHLVANFDYMVQILINLIMYEINTIESEGMIFINADLINGIPTLCVKDTGQGIDLDELDKVFDISLTKKKNRYCAGICLYIVKDLISRMNGEIKVNSKIGQGFEFIIKFK